MSTTECGIVLQGSEVKSLREGKAQLADAYARVDDGELWLFGLHIPPWKFASGFGTHDPDRKRKLLVHRHEIEVFTSKMATQPLTLVPLKVYFPEVASFMTNGKPSRNAKINVRQTELSENTLVGVLESFALSSASEP